ncbi:MAG: protein translocase subunit SecF [Nanoarchaeota archaeon]
MSFADKFKEFYTKNYRKLIILPIILIIFSLIVIFNQVSKTNDIFNKDVSLKGGITVTIYSKDPIDINSLKFQLSNKFTDVNIHRLSEFGSDEQIGVIIDVAEIDESTLKSTLEEFLNIKLTEENYSIEVVGSSLGTSFYNQMIKALIFAFILMALVVFIAYRSFIPSIAVVLAALFDITVTIAILNLIDFRISTAGIAALLMLIGYSVDTDILQTTRVLKKREPTPIEGVLSSMKTGLTMTITSIAAVFVGYMLSTSSVFKEIFLIINIGLLVDIIMTYCMNAPMLISYQLRKESKSAQ